MYTGSGCLCDIIQNSIETISFVFFFWSLSIRIFYWKGIPSSLDDRSSLHFAGKKQTTKSKTKLNPYGQISFAMNFSFNRKQIHGNELLAIINFVNFVQQKRGRKKMTKKIMNGKFDKNEKKNRQHHDTMQAKMKLIKSEHFRQNSGKHVCFFSKWFERSSSLSTILSMFFFLDLGTEIFIQYGFDYISIQANLGLCTQNPNVICIRNSRARK